MRIADLEAKINLFSLIEQNHVIKREGKTHRVNPCPVCDGSDHFTIYPETNSYSSFSDCCKGGSVYKYLQEVEGFTETEAWKELHEMAGESEFKELDWDDEIGHEKGAQPQQPTKAEGTAPTADYTAQINEVYHKQTEQDRDYFLNRGIPQETIAKYKLGVWRTNDGLRAILPICVVNCRQLNRYIVITYNRTIHYRKLTVF